MAILSRANVTLAYLGLVLLAGGASAAAIGLNILLQLAGVALIFWTLASRSAEVDRDRPMRPFVLVLAALLAMQFIMLPPAIWPMLPGRKEIADGYALLGAALPWMTISLDPWRSLASMMWWLPALAIFISMRASGAPTTRSLIVVVSAIASVSALLAICQRALGIAYLYEITNYGEGPGFFANSNHQGTFMLMSLALVSALSVIDYKQSRGLYRARVFGISMHLLVAALLLLSVLASGSLACVAMLFPVLFFIFLMARPDFKIHKGIAATLGIFVIAGFGAFLLFGPVSNDLTHKGVIEGISRQDFLITGLKPLVDFAPFGSGLGTFQQVYHWYENPGRVTSTFVNHAHNDLLEILIETSVLGALAIALFLAWFFRTAVVLWNQHRDNYVGLAASVATGAALLHSLVDYPLRTAAVSSLFAVCCVLMVRPAEEGTRRRSRDRRGAPKPEVKRELVRI